MKPKTQAPSFPITNSKSKKITLYPTPSFHFCFRPRPPTRSIEYPNAPPAATTSTANSNPNLTTSLYQTNLGTFSLTWSKSLLSRSLHIHLHPNHSLSTSPISPSLTSPLFHLTLKPFHFWSKQGIKKLQLRPSNTIWIFWDLTNAKFGSGPEPESGFYIAVLSHGEMSLLVGDMDTEAYTKTKVKNGGNSGSLVLRREHVVGKNKMYVTKLDLGGKTSDIWIELNESIEDDPRLVIMFDQSRVLYVKHLKWKFRGSERVEVNGHSILVSWDVHNWLFDSDEFNQDDGYALFTFRIENLDNEDGKRGDEEVAKRVKGISLYSEDSCGLNFEGKKMKKRLLMKSRSPSFSSSLSSLSSSCSSVLEWESVEENELKGPTGFSLLVYAWKS